VASCWVSSRFFQISWGVFRLQVPAGLGANGMLARVADLHLLSSPQVCALVTVRSVRGAEQAELRPHRTAATAALDRMPRRRLLSMRWRLQLAVALMMNDGGCSGAAACTAASSGGGGPSSGGGTAAIVEVGLNKFAQNAAKHTYVPGRLLEEKTCVFAIYHGTRVPWYRWY
jgi:hypothetical protein